MPGNGNNSCYPTRAGGRGRRSMRSGPKEASRMANNHATRFMEVTIDELLLRRQLLVPAA